MRLTDLTKILNIVRDATGETPDDLRYEEGQVRFNLPHDEDMSKIACDALLSAGLQHTPGDGEPEYYRVIGGGTGTIEIKWPVDLERPIWNE
jgi:hypothetical protein